MRIIWPRVAMAALVSAQMASGCHFTSASSMPSRGNRGKQPFATSIGQASGYSIYADRCYLAELRPRGFSSDERAIAAQLADGMRRDVPQLDAQIAAGDFAPMTSWLRDAVHSHGARLPAHELIKQATGKPLSAQASLRYLESKYLAGAPANSAAA